MIYSIIITLAAFMLGAFIGYMIMKAENRSDRKDHREAYADAVARLKNAESVAAKYAEIMKEHQDLFVKHGVINCSVCGKYTRYADAWEDRNANAIAVLCPKCAAKSLGQKDVKHV